jgi:hypothetical protein
MTELEKTLLAYIYSDNKKQKQKALDSLLSQLVEKLK